MTIVCNMNASWNQKLKLVLCEICVSFNSYKYLVLELVHVPNCLFTITESISLATFVPKQTAICHYFFVLSEQKAKYRKSHLERMSDISFFFTWLIKRCEIYEQYGKYDHLKKNKYKWHHTFYFKNALNPTPAAG